MRNESLRYILGVLLGDGYRWIDRSRSPKAERHWRVGLHAKDEKFVHTFAFHLSKLLNRNYTVWKEKRGLYRVDCSSKLLYDLKEANINKVEEIAKEEPEAFLKGIFDSDGCGSVFTRKFPNKAYHYPIVSFTNTRKELVELVTKLLRSIGISAKIYLKRCRGNPCFDRWKSTTDQYQLIITKRDDVLRYMKKIGFRKRVSPSFLKLVSTSRAKELEEVICEDCEA